MKRVITVLMALTMVFGVATMASADCFNCAGTAGNIARGCEAGQQNCYPFDFETPSDYCVGSKVANRAVFKICDCITDGDFATIVAGDTLDVTFEILVNGDTGDNGVYWAEEIGAAGVNLGLFNTQDDACDADYPYGSYFAGDYEYLTEDDTIGTPLLGADLDCNDITNSNRVIKIQVDEQVGVDHGYVIQPEDETEGNASWVIDIPAMRVDPAMTTPGDQVWVRICLLLNCGGICTEDTICCCDIYIGELCCSDDSVASYSLVYPYYPPANSAAFNLLGMVITNLSANDGEATITMYEDDGDVGTLTVDVNANGIYLTTLANLTAAMTSTGTMGDSMSYITVAADFPATGFAMIADTVDGASMGYLPLKR